MRNILNICSIMILLLMLILACAPGVHRAAIDKDKRTDAEHRFEPLGFPGDDAVITGKHRNAAPAQPAETQQSQALTDDMQFGEAESDSMLVVEEQVIFRVQVFASKSFDEAQQFASDVEGMFPEGVFVEYQMPYYKVRVGEFYSPEEGEVFLDEVKQIGFKNAWLVRVIQ